MSLELYLWRDGNWADRVYDGRVSLVRIHLALPELAQLDIDRQARKALPGPSARKSG